MLKYVLFTLFDIGISIQFVFFFLFFFWEGGGWRGGGCALHITSLILDSTAEEMNINCESLNC